MPFPAQNGRKTVPRDDRELGGPPRSRTVGHGTQQRHTGDVGQVGEVAPGG
ncbi:MAG: hypothetical protein H7Y15_08645, partial [Pseudonocardia sp.]|nr:hypothetical protein [Pseudonocardia sp.]